MTKTSNGDISGIDNLEAKRQEAINTAINLNPSHLESTIVANSVNWTVDDIDGILNQPKWHKCMG